MLGLMTVKRHRETVKAHVAALESSLDSKDDTIGTIVAEREAYKARLDIAREANAELRAELATLRAQLPTRGDKGKFVRREAV